MSDILHYYLDLLRGENNDNYGFHNILNTMKLSRHGKVCGEHFDGIDLHNEPLANIHFSDENGEKPSSFRDCKVSRSCFLSGHSALIESMEFIDHNTLVSRSKNEVITWDIWSGVPVKTEDASLLPKEENEKSCLTREEMEEKLFEITGFHNYTPFGVFQSNLRSLVCMDRTITIDIEAGMPVKTEALFEITGVHNYTSFDIFQSNLIRLLVCTNDDDNAGVCDQFLVCDLKTKTFFHCGSVPLKINEEKYVFSDGNNKLFVYELHEFESKPVALNNILPGKIIDLSSIDNCNCIVVTVDMLNEDCQIDYIINVESSETVLYTKECIDYIAYISELDAFFISYQNQAELRNNKGEIIVNFTQYKRYKLSNVFYNSTQLVKISKTLDLLAVTNPDYGIELYSLKTGDITNILGGNTSVFRATVSNNRNYAIFCSGFSSTQKNIIWNIRDNQLFDYHEKTSYEFNPSYFSVDSNILAVYRDREHLIDLLKMDDSLSIMTTDVPVRINNYPEFCGLVWNCNNIFFLQTDYALLVYNIDGECIYSFEIFENLGIQKTSYTKDMQWKISNNLKYLAYVLESGSNDIRFFKNYHCKTVTVINCNTLERDSMDFDCICPLSVSNDGRYVTVAEAVDYERAIIETVILDIPLKKVCLNSKKIIANDHILLNYIKDITLRRFEHYMSCSWTMLSDSWTIKVPSSPDNSTFVTAYLVPNLYIKNCDFKDCIFDEETKEIIRQYLGMI